MIDIFDKEIISGIEERLKNQRQTVAVAESVTAGFLQAAFSQMKEAMHIFHGGMTVYNIGQKTRHLRVNPIEALNTNCVSELVASQMASEISFQFLSDWGIACTGYASPVPELGVQQTYVLYAFYKNDKAQSTGKIQGCHANAFEEQVYFANEILKKFLECLRGNK
jgi:PncC family amidohydrolase